MPRALTFARWRRSFVVSAHAIERHHLRVLRWQGSAEEARAALLDRLLQSEAVEFRLERPRWLPASVFDEFTDGYIVDREAGWAMPCECYSRGRFMVMTCLTREVAVRTRGCSKRSAG